jgi:hypothetical protein
MRRLRRWRALSPALAVTVVFLAACTRTPSPEDVARDYGRAFYASDAHTLWRMISTQDRRVKDEATFQRQHADQRGFTREAVQRLASYITAAPVKTTVSGDHATVVLRFRLPNANAAEIRTLMHDWDDRRLDDLAGAERARILARLDELHRQGAFPVVEGEETTELVREAGAWRVFLNWASGVRVRFAAAVDDGVPLRVSVSPAEVTLAPGERIRVTVQASNTGSQPVTARVAHHIEPAAHERHLALLLCPLFLPVTLEPGQSQEFVSEYVLLADGPKELHALAVRYVFRRPANPGGPAPVPRAGMESADVDGSPGGTWRRNQSRGSAWT